MKRTALLAAMAALAIAAFPELGEAQGRGRGNGPRANSPAARVQVDDRAAGRRREPQSGRRRDDRAEADVWWEILRPDTNRRNGPGPAFCRSGEGHPVFGRQWCRDKGFGLGRSDGVLWGRAGWNDVIFRQPRRRGELGRRDVIDVIGDIVLRRVEAQGNRIGVRGPITGRWLDDPTGALVLRILAGGVPLADFVDRGGRGRADLVLLNIGR